MNSNPCSVCGSTDVNLVGGFYYCVECGTQDTTAQETIIERTEISDGVYATLKTKAIRTKKDTVQMSEEWYIWHAFNFILCGLADELIKLGAQPSFKAKVLWIWSRYMQKYKGDEDNTGKVKDNDFLEEEKTYCNSDDGEEDDGTNSDIEDQEIGLIKLKYVVIILYLALNLDRSHIRLSDLRRYIREKRLSIMTCQKFLPTELRQKPIIRVLISNGNKYHAHLSCVNHLNLCHLFCQRLDLGTLHIPDIKEIVNVFIKELCLPKTFRNLVHSLLEYIPVKVMIEKEICRTIIPHFDVIAMAYVVMALKMCFGLDDDYEVKLSDAVDEINENENRLKSYRIGKSEPTDRLFSFRDWINYLEFRKIIVSQYYHPMAFQYGIEGDNMLAFDCYKDIISDDGLENQARELAHDLLNQIPQKDDYTTIPKSLFPSSVTPITTYTEIILPRIKDPQTRLLLSEDFSRYCLKYACQKLNLKTNGSDENLIAGVSNERKICNLLMVERYKRLSSVARIFVKDSDNKNWIHDYHKMVMEPKNVPPKHKLDYIDYENTGAYTCNNKTIPEVIDELENKANIFEEYFNNTDCDESVDCLQLDPEAKNSLNFSKAEIDDLGCCSQPKDQFKRPTPNFNESLHGEEMSDCDGTLGKEEVITQLICKACQNYRIPIPKHSEDKTQRKRKKDSEDSHSAPKRTKREVIGPKYPRKNEIATILTAYHSFIQTDTLQERTEAVIDSAVESSKPAICREAEAELITSICVDDTTQGQEIQDNKFKNIQLQNSMSSSDFKMELNDKYHEDPTLKNMLISKIKAEKFNTDEDGESEIENEYGPLIKQFENIDHYNYYIQSVGITSIKESYSFAKYVSDTCPNSLRYITNMCASLTEVDTTLVFAYLQKLEELVSNEISELKK